jgi:hypothetical protein
MSEPEPTKGTENVSPIALASFNTFFSMQVQKGIETYGTTLETANGRSAYNDGLAEAVDLVQYFTQLQMQYQYLLAFLRSQQGKGTLHESRVFKEVIQSLIDNESDLSDDGYKFITGMLRDKRKLAIDKQRIL